MSVIGALRQVQVVFEKELRDAVRDRRALFSVVLAVLVGPVIIGFMMNRIADRQRDAEEVQIPVVGMEHAPALVDWLNQQLGVEVVAGPEDPEQAVRDQQVEVVVVIPEDFAERFRSSRPAELRVISDGSRRAQSATVDRVRLLLQRYGAEIGSMRLIARGVSPAVATAVRLNEIEVSSAQQRAATILGFIPLMVMLAAFTGGMQIATDSTAGERERGSLESLLVNPVPRVALVAGKWLAATVMAMVTVALAAALCVAVLRFIPLEDLGLRFRFGVAHYAGIMAAVLPLCLLVAAIQACIATFARSFKEAQSYMGILILLPMLPGLVTVVYPVNSETWMYPVPMLGQFMLLTNVMGGRAPGVGAFLMAAVISAALALVIVRVTTGLFRSERIIFAR